MSILKENTKITWTWLKAQGFWKDGWGSPDYRKEHNTKMYETIRENELEDLGITWQILYFPKTFEGMFYYSGTRVDVAGRVVMTRTSDASNECFISPIVKSPAEIEMFIQQVFSESWEKFSSYKYAKSKYYGGHL